MLPDEAIDEFKEIYKKEFGEKLSDEEARRKAENLIKLFDAVYRPIKKTWVIKHEEGKKDQD